MLLLEFNDLFSDRLGQLGLSPPGRCRLQSCFTKRPILFDPAAQAARNHAHLGTDVLQLETFL
jgi:hypothetical protein